MFCFRCRSPPSGLPEPGYCQIGNDARYSSSSPSPYVAADVGVDASFSSPAPTPAPVLDASGYVSVGPDKPVGVFADIDDDDGDREDFGRLEAGYSDVEVDDEFIRQVLGAKTKTNPKDKVKVKAAKTGSDACARTEAAKPDVNLDYVLHG